VANFSQPSLHFKHHSAVAERDVATIRSGAVEPGRSLYFGLLLHVPPKLREVIDLTCQIAASMRGERFDPAVASRDLVEWLGDNVVHSVELASRVARLRDRAGFTAALVATASNQPDWNVQPLLKFAKTDTADAMSASLDSLAHDASGLAPSGRRAWRPHHW
jgi:hypothetical protein